MRAHSWDVTMDDGDIYWVTAKSASEAMSLANNIAAYWSRAHRAVKATD